MKKIKFSSFLPGERVYLTNKCCGYSKGTYFTVVDGKKLRGKKIEVEELNRIPARICRISTDYLKKDDLE